MEKGLERARVETSRVHIGYHGPMALMALYTLS